MEQNKYHNMETEVWKDILEVGGMYQISSFGRVRSKEKVIEKKNGARLLMPERVMNRTKGNQGYLVILFKYMGKVRGFVVHRLVAKYFLDNPENSDVVKFKDGDKMNPHKDNLYWVSSGSYKKCRRLPSNHVAFDELSELWDVIIDKQHFASYDTEEKANTVLKIELERRNHFSSEEAPYRRNIIPQRANKIFRTHSQFIYG